MPKNVVRRTFPANAAKGFFIHMLTRDIALDRSVLDLLDNCVDGALRIRKDRDFRGLWVKIDFSAEQFSISDNCGGISRRIASDYAFCFGRESGAKYQPGSVGRFGVGMKRAFFKLGQSFRVASQAKDGGFVVDEATDDWETRRAWNFPYRLLKPAERMHENGTAITVSELHEEVASDFQREEFTNDLQREIELAHRQAIKRGLQITLNGRQLRPATVDVLSSRDIVPAVREFQHDGVRIRLVAGVGEPQPRAAEQVASELAGWYVYCNSRMVLKADKTWVTGWGDGIPGYHGQYSLVRGHAFFHADDPAAVPWNTTKDGVNADSPVYRAARATMIEMMRPVITFLNALDRERRRDGKFLKQHVAAARATDVDSVRGKAKFRYPTPPPSRRQRRSDVQKITYEKPRDQYNVVKAQLGVETPEEVGEQTFDYFLEECCEH